MPALEGEAIAVAGEELGKAGTRELDVAIVAAGRELDDVATGPELDEPSFAAG